MNGHDTTDYKQIWDTVYRDDYKPIVEFLNEYGWQETEHGEQHFDWERDEIYTELQRRDDTDLTTSEFDMALEMLSAAGAGNTYIHKDTGNKCFQLYDPAVVAIQCNDYSEYRSIMQPARTDHTSSDPTLSGVVRPPFDPDTD